MIYELRIYRCVPGRLPDLLKRAETVTLKLLAKHGIRQAGFWTTIIGECGRKWPLFMDDPEWVATRAETEKNGPLIANVSNTILQPTTFSSVQ
jgi:hypothetical protein